MVKCVPVNTWAFAFDEYIRIRVNVPHTIRVYRNTVDADNIVYEGPPGEVTLGDAQTTLVYVGDHTLIVTDTSDNEICRIPARWEPDTTTFISYSIVDENGNPLSVHIHVFNTEKGLIHYAFSEGGKVPILPSTYLELFREKNGKKYYLIQPAILVAPGTLILVPAEKHYVQMTMTISILDNEFRGWLGKVVKYWSEFVTWFTSKFMDLMLRTGLPVARKILEALDISLPLIDVKVEQVDSNTIRITYILEQDISPLAVALVLSVIAGVTFLVFKIDEIKSITQWTAIKSYYDWRRETEESYQIMVSHCAEIFADDQVGYQKCIDNAQRIHGYTLSTGDNALKQAIEDLDKTRSEADKWKLIAAGVGGGLIALLLRSRTE